MDEDIEQTYQAQLLRDRAQARMEAAEAEEAEEATSAREIRNGTTSPNTVRIGLVEGILLLEFTLIIDFIQFLVHTYATLISFGIKIASFLLPALRAVRIALSVIGWSLGVSAYVIEWAVSIIIGVTFLLWLIWKGVSMLSRNGPSIYYGLLFAVLGESAISFLPVWTGFIIFVMYKLRSSDSKKTFK